MRVNPYIEPLLLHVTEQLNRPFADAAELAERWESHGILPQPPASAAEVHRIRRFVREWGDVVDATDERERVDRVNLLLRRYSGPPSITDHDGSGWHLHFRDENAGFAETLTGSTAAAAAQFLTDRGMHRLGRCADPGCRDAFVDLSRAGTQRYCTRVCANRDAVRRHRARHR